MSLNLNPDIEARLNALAQASGVSIEEFLQHVVEERSAMLTKRMPPDEWVAQFEQWADSFPPSLAIPDEALNRENLYPDSW